MSQATTTVFALDSREEREPTYLSAMVRRTMWGAILAGAVTAISTQFLFTVLGIALGLSIADPAGTARSVLPTGVDSTPSEGIAVGVGVWWLVTGTVSLLLGGAVLGRVGGMVRSVDAMLHALTMWAVVAIFGFTILWSGAGIASATGWRGADHASAQGRSLYSGSAAGSTPSGRTDSTSRSDSTSRTDSASRSDSANTSGQLGDRYDSMTLEREHRTARAASWWSVLGLLIGVAASLGGAWITAPNRIVMRPAAHPGPAV